MPEGLDLSSLKPASPRKDRKRVGRGMGSGTGRYSGRGLKGQKSRAGSHKMRPGFEGGQMPVYMRLGKQRGATSKDAMPIGPHRTKVWAVNVRDLERFDAGVEVTPELLKQAGLIRNTRYDVKILGQGELETKLTVSAHNFSKSAREKIEGAGGAIVWLRGEPKPKVKKRHKPKPVAAAEPEVPEDELAEGSALRESRQEVEPEEAAEAPAEEPEEES